jgi:DNA-binding NarL/FixJ family response regulator
MAGEKRIFYVDDSQAVLDALKQSLEGHPAGPGDHRLLVETSRPIQGEVGRDINFIKNCDALVLDYSWGSAAGPGQNNGVKYAGELRRRGYEGPIIIFSMDDRSALRKAHPEYDALGLEYCCKTHFLELYPKLQQALKRTPGREPGAGM